MKKIVAILMTALMLLAVLAPAASATTPTSPVKSYDEAEPGELLYTVNFNGDAAFTPARTANDQGYMGYEISADGSAVTIKTNQPISTDTDKKANLWGGLIKDLPATEDTIYSMVYKAKANGAPENASNAKNNAVGVGGWAVSEADFATTSGVYNVYSNHNTKQLDNGVEVDSPDQRTALSQGVVKMGESTIDADSDGKNGYKYTKDYPAYDVDDDGYVTALVVYNGKTCKFSNYMLKDGATNLKAEASWIKFDERNMYNALNGIDKNYMCFWTYAFYNVADTTIKDVQYYKEFLWEKPADAIVASATVNGTTTYYDNFAELVYEANGSGNTANRWTNFEIVLYKDVTLDTAIIVADAVTVKAAEGLTNTPTLTVEIANLYNGRNAYRGGFVFASAANKVEFKDINVVVKKSTLSETLTPVCTSSLVMINSNIEATVWAGHSEVIFDNVTVTSAGSVINQYGTSEFTNCYVTVNGGSFTATGDFIEASRSTRAEKFAFNLTVTGGATFNVAKIYSTPTVGIDNYITYGNDGAAKAAGFKFRVGATEGGKEDVVYFTAEQAAKDYADANNSIVYALETGAVVYCPHAPSGAGVETLAPTCTREGVVTHTCALCGETYTEPVAVVPHADAANDGDHKCDTCTYVFENVCADAADDDDHNCDECGEEDITQHTGGTATCTKKAKCSVCNQEFGELLAHTKTADPTCVKKSVCSVCNQEFGELASHNYSAATCIKKSTCTVCGEETGDLAYHRDQDLNGKCDVCDDVLYEEVINAIQSNDEELKAKLEELEKKLAALGGSAALEGVVASDALRGCSGTVSVAGIALVATLGVCAVCVDKKKRK